MNYTPRFCQIKDLIKIYICGKFHQYSICSCEIKKFQSFLCIDSVSMKWPLFELFGPYIPYYCSILLKFWPDVVQLDKHIWKILQNSENCLKWNALKVYSFGPFWGPIYCWVIPWQVTQTYTGPISEFDKNLTSC